MSRGRPVGLTIATIAVIAAGLLLWLIVQSGDDDTAAATAPSASAPADLADPAARPRAARGSSAPEIAKVERGTADPGDYTETIVNGMRVRDHRKDKSKPMPHLEAPQRAPGARQIPSTLTAAISNRILPIVRKCGANIPADARGEKPRLQSGIIIAIRDQQVNITQATLHVTDVVDSALDSVKQCISSQVVGLTMSAGDERDLDEHSLSLSFPL